MYGLVYGHVQLTFLIVLVVPLRCLDKLLQHLPGTCCIWWLSGIGRENHKMMLDHYQQTCW